MPTTFEHNEITYVTEEGYTPDARFFNVRAANDIAGLIKMKQVNQELIHTAGEFKLYIESTSLSRQYYVEHAPSKNRVTLDEALKEGEINGMELDTPFYDWLHDYDETLD